MRLLCGKLGPQPLDILLAVAVAGRTGFQAAEQGWKRARSASGRVCHSRIHTEVIRAEQSKCAVQMGMKTKSCGLTFGGCGGVEGPPAGLVPAERAEGEEGDAALLMNTGQGGGGGKVSQSSATREGVACYTFGLVGWRGRTGDGAGSARAVCSRDGMA